jgi:hypothetical protein
MKTKLRKNHKSQAEPIPIPEESLRTAREGETLLRLRLIGGKWQGNSTVAWRISLPILTRKEDNAYLDKLRLAFLRFLKKESEKPWDEVRFGGMEWESTPEGLLLKTAFCPFSQREYRPKALFILNEAGEVAQIRLLRQNRRGQSPSLPSQASSAQRQPAGQGEKGSTPSRRKSKGASPSKALSPSTTGKHPAVTPREMAARRVRVEVPTIPSAASPKMR